MEYRHLGKAGLKVSELSLGSWITFGGELDLTSAKSCMRIAFDNGVNLFDNAEVYASGAAELLMGEVLKDYRREDLVLSTKIFWGGNGPNDQGLSWKHLVEGTKNSLRRLQLDYVDLLFCHRPDPTTPIEETVRAMDHLVQSGLAFYWGTSEWSAKDIETAFQIAKEIHAIPPAMEQPEYNMLHRSKIENEFVPLYARHGIGATTWSPLAGGILTGKYNQGIPSGSRLAKHPGLRSQLTERNMAKIDALKPITLELDCTLAQLAIAWCLKNPHVSSVITGASKPEQVKDNMKAIAIKAKLTDDIMQQVENILKQ